MERSFHSRGVSSDQRWSGPWLWEKRLIAAAGVDPMGSSLGECGRQGGALTEKKAGDPRIWRNRSRVSARAGTPGGGSGDLHQRFPVLFDRQATRWL